MLQSKKRPNDGLNLKPWHSLLVGIALLFSTQANAQKIGTYHLSNSTYHGGDYLRQYTRGVPDNLPIGPNVVNYKNDIMWMNGYKGTYFATRGDNGTDGSIAGLSTWTAPTTADLIKYTVGIGWSNVSSSTSPLFLGRFFCIGSNTFILTGVGTSGICKYSSTLAVSASNPSVQTVINAGVTGLTATSFNYAQFYDGTYIYFHRGAPYEDMFKYDPVTNTASPVTTLLTTGNAASSSAKMGNAIYYKTQTGPLYKYDLTTQTHTKIQATTDLIVRRSIDTDGQYLYALPSNGTNTVYDYNFATNTWNETVNAVSIYSNQRLVWNGLSTSPTVTASAISATCTGTSTNSNAKLVLNSFANVTKVGYSIGSTYTGPAFASATTLTAAPFTVASTLPNPTVNQPYTIRVFASATSYIDNTVIISPINCITADLSLTVATATQTGNKGETLTYTFTATNSGPNAVTDAIANINIPSNATLLNANPSQGTYSESTKQWNIGAIANGGSKTLTISVKVN